MNTETDRDLTTEDQEPVTGGLFFRDDLSGEFADKFLHDPAPYYPGRVNPNPLGCDTGIFADFRDCSSPANQPAPAFRLPAGRRCG
jgi:hypothetical protein